MFSLLSISIYAIESGRVNFFAKASTGSNWYVATNGSAGGDGTVARPWDLKSVISGDRSDRIRPGDTVYLRGGVYGDGGNICGDSYKVYLGGDSGEYITISSYPGEIATINEGVSVYGPGWIIFRDLEITNTDTNRYTELEGSHHCSGYTRNSGFAIYTGNVKLINNYIHDAGNGISAGAMAVGLEVYGNIVQNNGWVAPDRAHGHGIYLQNNISLAKKANNNIVMPGLDDTGMHLYGADGMIHNISMENNIHYTKRWLMQTSNLSSNVSMKNNYLWNSYIMAEGISDSGNGLQITGNYSGGEGEPEPVQTLLLKNNLRKFNISGNTFCFSEDNHYFLIDEVGYKSDSKHIFNNNYVCEVGRVKSKDQVISYESWKRDSGFASTQEIGDKFRINKVVVIPNSYEEKRGQIAIYNWQNLDSIEVNISSLGYKNGDRYSIYNAENYLGDEPIRGTYDGGLVSIDMRRSRWSLARPIGGYPSGAYNPGSSYPRFGAFIIRADGASVTNPGNTDTPTATRVPTIAATATERPRVSPSPTVVRVPTQVVVKPTEVAVKTSNLIRNPGFEEGELNWIVYSNGVLNHKASSNSYSGQYSEELNFVKSGSNEQLYQKDIYLEANTRYKLSFFGKSNQTRTVWVAVHKHGTPYTDYGLAKSVRLSSDWKEFSLEFVTKGFVNSTDDARLRFYFAGYSSENDRYYFDEVKLEKI